MKQYLGKITSNSRILNQVRSLIALHVRLVKDKYERGRLFLRFGEIGDEMRKYRLRQEAPHIVTYDLGNGMIGKAYYCIEHLSEGQKLNPFTSSRSSAFSLKAETFSHFHGLPSLSL